MSFSVTDTMASMPLMDTKTITTQPAREPADVKSKFMAKLEKREDHFSARMDKAFEKVSARLDRLNQVAMDNDYSHLATFANKAMDAVDKNQQRVAGLIDHRFGIAKKLLELRPEGGYKISAETAESLSNEIKQHTETRLAALEEKSVTMNERLAELGLKASENGYDGARIDKLIDRMANRLEHSIERITHISERALELIQNRIDTSYDVPPETETVEDEVILV